MGSFWITRISGGPRPPSRRRMNQGNNVDRDRSYLGQCFDHVFVRRPQLEHCGGVARYDYCVNYNEHG